MGQLSLASQMGGALRETHGSSANILWTPIHRLRHITASAGSLTMSLVDPTGTRVPLGMNVLCVENVGANTFTLSAPFQSVTLTTGQAAFCSVVQATPSLRTWFLDKRTVAF